MEPRDRTFHNPPIAPQPTSVGGAAPSDVRANTAEAQAASVRLGVVSSIGEQRLGPTARPARLASDRRDRVYQGLQFGDVGSIGSSQGRCQRDASRVGDDVVLAPWLGPISRVRAGRFAAPPKHAPNRCRLPLATNQSDQRPEVGQAVSHAGPARHQPFANHSSAANRSCRYRSRVHEANLPN